MKKVLLTNDDGFYAAGLQQLYAAALEKGYQPIIVAPAQDCSGFGHGAHFRSPIKIKQTEQGYIVEGTPADCIYIAVQHLKLDIDVIFSGINDGANLGDDLWYSATAAGAREGALNNIPAIAFSQVKSEPWQLDLLAKLCFELYESKPPSPGQWFNYNFPPQITKQVEQAYCGRRERGDTTEKFVDSRGTRWVWLGPAKDGIITPGSDFDIISRNIISLTISGV